MRGLVIAAAAGALSVALAVGAARGQGAVPAAPTELMATSPADAVIISLEWRDNSDNEEGWIVQRSAEGPQGAWSVVANLPADPCPDFPEGRECYDDGARPGSGLRPRATYWYRVAAVNAAARSEYSNIASAEVSEPFPLPVEPTVVLPPTGDGPGGTIPWRALTALLAAAGSLLVLSARLAARRA